MIKKINHFVANDRQLIPRYKRGVFRLMFMIIFNKAKPLTMGFVSGFISISKRIFTKRIFYRRDY